MTASPVTRSATDRRLLVCCETHRKAVPYVEALQAVGFAGGEIEVLVPGDDHPAAGAGARDAARRAAGLVICGGPDLEPRRYGEEPLPGAELSLMPELDALEFALLAGAEEGRTPSWLVCRGLQTFNVYRGGTLWQDIPLQVGRAVDHQIAEPLDALAHAITRLPAAGDLDGFRDLLEPAGARVNSRHHQAIKDLGRGVVPLAASADGVIEIAAFDSSEWWAKGVQWHPENLVHLPAQRRLWQAFADAVSRHAARNAP